jgi:hypothetical protein
MSRQRTIVLVSAALTLLGTPGITKAEEAFWSAACTEAQYPSFYPGAVEACERERKQHAEEAAKAASEEAQQAAQQATQEAEERAPATALEVTVRQRHGGSYSHPGRTEIVVKTTPFATVTITADQGARTLRYRNTTPIEEEPEAEARRVQGFLVRNAEGAEGALADEIEGSVIRWSCRHPRETIRYTVTAQGASGSPLTHNAVFTIPLSARWCAAAKRKERRELEVIDREEAHHHVEERREAAEHARHEAEAQHHELEQWEANCRQLGGSVVWLHVGKTGATAPYCRSPGGGIIDVPA